MSVRLTIFVCLLLLAGISRWWLLSLREEPALPPTPTLRSDYSLADFDLWVADLSGQPKYRISGPQLTQQSSGNLATVERPSIDLFDRGKLDWQISAAAATLNLDADQVTLSGETLMSDGNQQITTRNVLIDNRARTAVSTEGARLEQGGDWISGRGLKVDFQLERIELETNVTAHYQAKSGA